MPLTKKLIDEFLNGETKNFTLSDKFELVEHMALLNKTSLSAFIGTLNPTFHTYLVTFTIDPKKVDNPKKQQKEIYKNICKQFERPPLHVSKAQIVTEGDGEKKHIHFHVAVQTRIPLKKDRFHYYQKKYGLIDISKSKTGSYEEVLNYISKENKPVVLI